jgi:hypothetical protein
MFSAPFLATLLDRVKAVVRRVARPAAYRARPGEIDTTAHAAEALISPVVRGLARGWMSAKLRALSSLMRRIEAGATSPGRAPSAQSQRDVAVVRSALPPEERLPRGFGWMCGFGPDVQRDGRAFAEWLNEPAMKAKVLAEPERMARLIGPILTATGAARPEWFPATPRKAQRLFPPSGERPAWEADTAESREDSNSNEGSGRTVPPAPWPAPGAEPTNMNIASLQRNRRFPMGQRASRSTGHRRGPSENPPAYRLPMGTRGDASPESSAFNGRFHKNEMAASRKTHAYFVAIS